MSPLHQKFTPQEINELLAAIVRLHPNITHPAVVDSGGFKLVIAADVAGKKEALKVLPIPEEGSSPDQAGFRAESVGRISREVAILDACKTRYLVKLGSIPPHEFEANGSGYFLYSEEFLEGDNLWKILNRSGPFPTEDELISLFCCLTTAVQELWTTNHWIHRDIKPSNIIKTADPMRPFVLLDLGIAFSVRETTVTYNASARLPMATHRYLAPEMMESQFRSNADFRTDLYAVGLSIFEYGAKKHPIARGSDDLITTITRAIQQAPQQLENLRADLSADFCHLVNQLLKKKPALRPANIETLLKVWCQN